MDRGIRRSRKERGRKMSYFGQHGRATILAIALAGLATAVAVSALVTSAPAQAAKVAKRHFVQGLAISPVPLDLAGKNRALVGLGSYLVNAVGGCNDCHTNPSYAPGGDPFLGQPAVVNASVYLAGGRPFGPGIVSANITPDANGLPAGLTLKEFITTLRTGRDPDHPDKILQVMPWPVYANMTDRDLRAVYEYLKAIPPLPFNGG